MGYDLAGLRAPVTLLWNRGGLRFERVELAETGTRAVVAVDIEGDGLLPFNPHFHALILEGGFDAAGRFIFIPLGDS